MYNIAYDEPDFVSENFYRILQKIQSPSIEEDFDYYYFNSVKKQYNKADDKNITQSDLLAFYDISNNCGGMYY